MNHLSSLLSRGVIERRAPFLVGLTHTSGLVYGFWDEQIAQYLEANGIPPVVSGLRASLGALAFDPGDRWQYGSGVDWLGLVVEALDGRSIRQFCHEESFDPLRMPDTRFELDKVLAARHVPAFARSAEGGFVEPQINVDPPAHPEFYGMGHALYSTAADYMRFLRMWLGKGQLDGVQTLKPDSATQYLENHIGELRVLPLRTALPAAVEDLILFPSCPKTHSLGFARTEKDMEGMRAAGSQFWGGVLTHF
jgi:methyl acetate hydrolase